MMGDSLDGFTRTQFPEATAAVIIPTVIASGKFQGGMTRPTPVSYTHLTLPTSDLV